MPQHHPISKETQPVLLDENKMDRLIQRHDWSNTPLGSRDKWPSSLATLVNMMLHSQFGMLIMWGQDVCMIYNDQYVELMGQKHPSALGRPLQEVWHEVWDDIHPMVEQVMQTGQSVFIKDLFLLVNRYNYNEECYFTFCYSALHDDTNQIAGVLDVVTETTEQVIATRRLKLLHHLNAQVIKSKTFEIVCTALMQSLETNLHDIPFALLYRIDHETSQARRLGGSGISPNLASSPMQVGLTESCWPFQAVINTKQAVAVEDLMTINDLPMGAWSIPPDNALLLPLLDSTRQTVFAVLIVAVNPHKKLDNTYREFFDLLARQMGSIMTDALAYEFENAKRYEIQQQDELRYRTLTETTQAIIWSANTQGHFNEPQASWQEFTGQTVSQYRGFGWLTAIHEDDREQVRRNLLSPDEKPQAFHQLVRIRVKAGYYKYIIFNVVPLFNQQQAFIEWMGTGVDIHALKRTEEQLLFSNQQLNQALASAQVGTWSADLHTQKVDLDINFLNLYDIEPSTFGHTLSEAFITLHPDDVDRTRLLFEQAIAEHKPYQAEFRVIHRDKSVHHIAARGKIVYENDQPQRIVGTVWDNTLEKERQLLQTAEVYRQKLEEYIDTICHEIRNPLNGIYGGVYALETVIQNLQQLLAQKSTILSWEIGSILAKQLETLKETYDNLKVCSEQQKLIVDDVLDLSKIERNKLELQINVFDPKQAILNAARMFNQILTQKHLKLHFNLPDDICYIAGDESRFNQVLINLLSNASKFTNYGSITLSLTYHRQANDQIELEVHVQDTGSGMSAEQISRLFQPFTQVHKGNHQGGSGLGLAISQKLTQLMGGSMNITSQVGLGSDFSFTIMATRAKAPSPTEQRRSSVTGTLNPTAYHILIVEDNLINQKVLMRLLDKENHTYVVANNGLEGWQCYLETQFDVILMDIEMPVMGGLAATRRIRAHEQQAHKLPIPIIGLSGNARTEQIEQAKVAGMDEYLTKPFHQQTLRDLIAKVTLPAKTPLSTSPDSPLGFFNHSFLAKINPYVEALQQEAKALFTQGYPFEMQRQERRLIITLARSKSLDDFVCQLLLEKLKVNLQSVFGRLSGIKTTLTDRELKLYFEQTKDARLVRNVLKELGFMPYQSLARALPTHQHNELRK